MTETDRLKKRTSLLSIISNTTLVLLKLVVGLSVGALSLVSEALHSGVDLIAALIAYWAVHKSVTPPDQEHDYGHGKYENLSAAVEALLIVGAAVGIVYEAVDKFHEAAVPEGLGYGIAIMIVSIVINYFVSARLMSVAKKTESQALEADGLHLRSDIWTSVGVLVGLGLMELTGWPWLDPVIAIFVAGIIFHAGWKMIVESTRQLTDESLPKDEERKIGAIIRHCPEVKGYHCMRTRRSGSYRLLDVHVLFDGNMPLSRVHAVCDEIEQGIRRAFGTFDIMIHPEPANSGFGDETNASHYEAVEREGQIAEERLQKHRQKISKQAEKKEGFQALFKELRENIG